MEFNFKSNSAYSYMRYGGYQGKYKGKEYYMVPNPEASINIRDLYDNAMKKILFFNVKVLDFAL